MTTALPTITKHFHSSSGYTWIGSAYLLAVAAATPIWGKLSDIWGRKPTIVMAACIFFIGSALSGASVSITMLIVGRAVQGVGGGGLITLVNICISDLFSMRNRATYFGIIGMVWALASAIGPIMGGALTEKVSFRWCFYINREFSFPFQTKLAEHVVPCTGVAIVIFIFFLDLKTPKTPLWAGLKAIDWQGSLAIVGGTLMLLLGLEFGGITFPWKSATVICLIIFGILTMVLFFFNEYFLAKYPVMPFHLFRSTSNVASLLVCFVHGFVFIAGAYYLPLYFQAVLSASPLVSGVYSLPFILVLSLTSGAVGAIIRKTGEYLWPIRIGLFLMTLGFGLFIYLPDHSEWGRIAPFLVIAGLGCGPNFQSPLIALQTGVPPRDIAAAVATFAFTRNIATAMSVVIGGVIFQNGMQKQLGTLSAALGPQTAELLSGGAAGANVGVAATLPEDQRAVVRKAFTHALREMWILYVAIGFVGIIISLFIKRRVLSKVHEETKTGLEAEEVKRLANKEARSKKPKDIEAAGDAVEK